MEIFKRNIKAIPLDCSCRLWTHFIVNLGLLYVVAFFPELALTTLVLLFLLTLNKLFTIISSICYYIIILKNSVSMSLERKMMRSYIWSVVTFGSEAWTINKEIRNKINVFECYKELVIRSY